MPRGGVGTRRRSEDTEAVSGPHALALRALFSRGGGGLARARRRRFGSSERRRGSARVAAVAECPTSREKRISERRRVLGLRAARVRLGPRDVVDALVEEVGKGGGG